MLDRLLAELPQFLGYYNVVFLAKAALATVALARRSAASSGSLLGLLLALVRLTRSRWLAPLRWLAVLFTELFRRIPFLVTLMLVFFAFQLSGRGSAAVRGGALSGVPDRGRLSRRDHRAAASRCVHPQPVGCRAGDEFLACSRPSATSCCRRPGA